MSGPGSDDGGGDGTRVYLGLGANLGDRAALLTAAVERLGMALSEVDVSPWYETAPIGFEDQPDFLNLVLSGRTSLSAHDTLRLALGIERGLGRRRGDGPRFGPRPIDIDLLLHGRLELDEPGLQLPHPRLAQRAFVLAPLRDLAPTLEIPGLTPRGLTVDQLWSALPASELAGVRRIAPLGVGPIDRWLRTDQG